MKRLIIGTVVVIALLAGGFSAAIMTLNSIDWSEYEEPIAGAVKDATGRELRFSGVLSLDIGFSPGIIANDVALQNVAWGSRDDMVTLEHVEVRLKLLPLIFGQIEVRQLEIVGFNLLLETNRQGKGNWEFEFPAADAPVPADANSAPASQNDDLLKTVFLQKAVIQNAKVVYIDGQTGTSQRIGIDEFVAQMDSASAPLQLDLTAFYDDERVELAGQISGISGLMSGEPLGLDMTMKAAGATLEIEGSLDQPLGDIAFELSVDASGDSLSRLSEIAGSPVAGLDEYNLAATVSGNPEQFNVMNLVAGVSGMQLDGELKIDLAEDPMRLGATLHSPRIDLTRLLPTDDAVEPSSSTTADATGDPGGRVFSQDPLPLDAFDSLDTIVADVALAIGELIVDSETTLNNVELGIHAAENTVAVVPLKLEVMGATIDGRVKIEAVRGAVAVATTFSVRHPSVGDLIPDDGDTMMAGGAFDLDFDVTGKGASVADIMGSLSGSLSADIGAAQVSNGWIQRAFAEAQAILTKSAPQQGGAGPIELKCMVTGFSIRDGLAEAESFVVDARNIAIFGDGQINLRDELLNLDFDWLAVGVDTRNALPPFEVRGTLAAPKGRFDTKALIGSALGLGAVAMTDDDFESSGMTAESGPERCWQRLVVYEQFREDRAQPKEITVESALDDIESTRDALKKLGGFFRKKK